jgi:hypothetical protein
MGSCRWGMAAAAATSRGVCHLRWTHLHKRLTCLPPFPTNTMHPTAPPPPLAPQ